jgi:hypothetical protein
VVFFLAIIAEGWVDDDITILCGGGGGVEKSRSNDKGKGSKRKQEKSYVQEDASDG